VYIYCGISENVDITGNGDVVSGVVSAAGNVADDPGDCISSAITGGTGSFGGAIVNGNVTCSAINLLCIYCLADTANHDDSVPIISPPSPIPQIQ